MYLVCYGTRPELLKLIPLINKMKQKNLNILVMFSGQHQDLIQDFKHLVNTHIILEDIMESGQSLNSLVSKILIKMDKIFEKYNIENIIIQGDTTTAYSIALSGFHNKKKVIHIEAGLRTYDKYSPFPEELNRKMISQLANIHICPTIIAVENLKKENIRENVYLCGNTIVDMYKFINTNINPTKDIKNIIEKYEKYILVTLHRRENRGKNMEKMWNDLNILSENKNIKYIYITHPSLPDSYKKLSKNIVLLEPVNYENMVYLISNCYGIISDSGGLQEEALCANKKILVCRDTTERPETINSGYGLLVKTEIKENIDFFEKKLDNLKINPYGENVCDKIIQIL
jgi:UDP-N-acetylglucosamine 2-epimerase (non-hydrolysing)